MPVSQRDLYRLRKAHLAAERAYLRAQMAQQVLKEVTLEIERRYNLLSREASVDIRTGKIQEESKEGKDESNPDAGQGATGPA